jgi:hypothetical protein
VSWRVDIWNGEPPDSWERLADEFEGDTEADEFIEAFSTSSGVSREDLRAVEETT